MHFGVCQVGSHRPDQRGQRSALVRENVTILYPHCRAALYPRAPDIARSLGWARAYDALYPAAAEIEDAELLTVGRGMSEAAARLGIPATLVR